MPDAPLLALDNVRSGYGDAVVLNNIALELPERGSLAVLGRNVLARVFPRTKIGLLGHANDSSRTRQALGA